MRPIRPRATCLPPIMALLLAVPVDVDARDGPRSALACEHGKGIERDLGQRGFRVVVAGGYRMRDDHPVKVQIWENEDSNWVITEAYIGRDRTCVVRTGRGLHMLY